MKKVSRDTKTFILISIIVGLAMSGDAMMYCILPVTPENFRITVFQIGILLSVNRFIRLITNELSNFIVAGTESYKPLVAGVWMAAFVTLGYAIPLGFWWLLALRILWGACFSLLRIEAYIATLRVSSDENVGRLMGWFATIKSGIYRVMMILSGFLADMLNPLAVPVIFAALIFGSLFFIRNQEQMWRDTAVAEPAVVDDKKKSKSRMHISNIGMLLIVGLVTFVTATASTMTTSLRGRLIVDVILPGSGLNIGAATFAGFFAMLTPVIMMAAPIFGYFGDKFGCRRPLIISMTGQAAIIILFAVFRLWYIVLGLLVLDLVTESATQVLRTAYAGKSSLPGEQALFMNRFSTFQDAGSAAGPFLGYAIYAVTNDFTGIALVMVPLIMVSIFILFCMEKKNA